MKRISSLFLVGILLMGGFSWFLEAQEQSTGMQYPEPRYPKIPKITSVEQLMPAARTLVAKEMTAGITQRPVYAVKEGERVLLWLNYNVDPLVVEALKRALEERNAHVDLIQMGNSRPGPADGVYELKRYPQAGVPEGLRSELLMKLVKEGNYDVVIGTRFGSTEPIARPRAVRMPWITREMFATAGSLFPEDLARMIDTKAWGIVRQAKRIRLQDPEGTDFSWSIFDDHWRVMEGSHPTIQTIGMGYQVGVPQDQSPFYTYGEPGTSERHLIGGHIGATPEGIVLPQSDAEGTVVSTSNHAGPFPRIEVTLKNNEIVSIEGGGEYGELWRQRLEMLKEVKFPMSPRRGHGFFMECAIGTNPKRFRPHNALEPGRTVGGFSEERGRSGIIHLGFGTILQEDSAFAREKGIPAGHRHLHLYFSTMTVTTRDDRQVKLIDKGRLTVLDDPEVRQLAAKYGDPDELLREDWIPAFPGINVPGDYLKDYAHDPSKWMTKEHREAYSNIIDYKPY